LADRPARRAFGADLRMVWRLLRAVLAAWRRQERARAAVWRTHQPWLGEDLSRQQLEQWAHERAEEMARRRGALRWRRVDGEWRLDGQVAPPPPAAGEQPARTD
jgi:hypothetical protein